MICFQTPYCLLNPVVPLSSAEAPAGYPHQNKIIEKIVPRALSFSFSPASPQHKETSAEERAVVLSFRFSSRVYCTNNQLQ